MTTAITYRARLALVIGLGLLARILLAFTTAGHHFDLASFTLVDQTLRAHPLDVYSLVNSPTLYHWPYPPGYFPVVLLAGSVAQHTGLAFTSVIRLPAIFADMAVACLAQELLRHRGASERVRLGAVAIVMAGPLFVLISGYNGQIDSLAVLPAIAALLVWESVRPVRRALFAGLLIGIGGAVKTSPLVMVLALLPSCRSRRECAVLVSAAAAVAVLPLVPFLISDAHGVGYILKYRGLAGQGGLSLLAQPDLSGIWVGWPAAGPMTGLSHTLQGAVGDLITVGALAAALLVAVRFRARSVDAATLIWFTLFAFSVNFRPNYAIWGLPFFLISGYLISSLALQAVLILPALLLLVPGLPHGFRYLFIPMTFVSSIAFLVGALIAARRIATRTHDSPQPGGVAGSPASEGSGRPVAVEAVGPPVRERRA